MGPIKSGVTKPYLKGGVTKPHQSNYTKANNKNEFLTKFTLISGKVLHFTVNWELKHGVSFYSKPDGSKAKVYFNQGVSTKITESFANGMIIKSVLDARGIKNGPGKLFMKSGDVIDFTNVDNAPKGPAVFKTTNGMAYTTDSIENNFSASTWTKV